jgi:hypothetical protein
MTKQADRIADLERRVRELEQAPKTYPVFVPYYVGPPIAPPAPVWPYTYPTYPWGPWISSTNIDAASPTITTTAGPVTGSEVRYAQAGYSA